ncbi:MAG TPA: phosphatase PAP2 family protein [Chitinophagaceae bacterium]|nr:phosphatase PAP2 family protein [Chitinophagaceae bacterium]
MKIIITLLLFALPVRTVMAQNVDINILREINLHRPRALDKAFIALNTYNDPVCAVLPLGILITGWITHDSSLTYNAGEAILALGMSAAVTLSLKYLVKRPRPYVTYPFIQHQVTENTPSFPSGDCTVTAALVTSLSLSYPKWYIILPGSLWLATVAYGRMDLGVHYPSDVLAGTLIGAGSAWLSFKAGKWLNATRSRHQVRQAF